MEKQQNEQTAQEILDLSSNKPSDDVIQDIFGGIEWSVPETNFNGLKF